MYSSSFSIYCSISTPSQIHCILSVRVYFKDDNLFIYVIQKVTWKILFYVLPKLYFLLILFSYFLIPDCFFTYFSWFLHFEQEFWVMGWLFAEEQCDKKWEAFLGWVGSLRARCCLHDLSHQLAVQSSSAVWTQPAVLASPLSVQIHMETGEVLYVLPCACLCVWVYLSLAVTKWITPHVTLLLRYHETPLIFQTVNLHNLFLIFLSWHSVRTCPWIILILLFL